MTSNTKRRDHTAIRKRYGADVIKANKNDLTYDISTDDTSTDESSSVIEKEGIIEYQDDDNRILVEKSAKKPAKSFYEKHEISRKAFHSATGFFTIWLYVNGYEPKQLVLPLTVMSVICFTQDIIRFRYPRMNKKFVKYYGFLMRESETQQFNGILFYLLGLLMTSSLLPKDLVVMCNIFLSWGDTIASFAGREFGRFTPQLRPGKSWAGIIANFALAYLTCKFFYGYMVPAYTSVVDIPGDIIYSPDSSYMNLEVFSVACGFISSFSEVVSVLNIDDNFTIPVISGAFLRVLVTVLHK